MKKFIGRILHLVRYPELVKAGGLPGALNREFGKMNSRLRVSENDGLTQLPFSYAYVENGSKYCQVYIAAKKKLYLSDFWRDGVCLGTAGVKKISDIAAAIDFWLNNDVSTAALAEKFSFVEPNGKAMAFDENKEVAYTWNKLVNEDRQELNEFIKLASSDEVLSTLFPYTSLYTLCFSRCTGYPFDSDDLPNVTPLKYAAWNTGKGATGGNNDQHRGYVVTRNRTEYIGEGDAHEALKIVRACLPGNIGPAVRGCKEDCVRYH